MGSVKVWRNMVTVLLGIFALGSLEILPASANTIVFNDDFETCTYQKYSDVALNIIDKTIRHSGNCSSRIGGGVTFGKLIRNLDQPRSELWFTAWVFFPPEFLLPAPGGGAHLWRLSNYDFQMDFNVPDRSSTVQLVHFPGISGGNEVVKGTSFNPTAGDRKGRWQCWEVHSRLNQPGKADGLVEFYADGAFVDSITGNFRGNSTAGYTIVDVQSNIGGNDSLWPTSNWWYIDDVVVSTERIGCLPDVADKNPPQSPTGLRINSQ